MEQNVLLSHTSIRQLAKSLSLTAVQQAIAVLQNVVQERAREHDILESIKQMAEKEGYTLAQLGLVSTQHVPQDVGADKPGTTKVVKPKFKTINLDTQYFYVENDKLQLLRTHTMKKGLTERGLTMLTASDLSESQLKEAKDLVAEATTLATISFNEKVDVWNEHAKAHGKELLEKR